MTTEHVSSLIALYGSGPRQRLEIARMKLRRVDSDPTATAQEHQNESERLRQEIAQLESEIMGTRQ